MFNRSFLSNLPPVTANILIINVVVWLFALIVPETTTQRLLDLGSLHYYTSQGFGIWQLVTYMFIQVDFFHLFFNMWALVIFGATIERTLGSRRFVLYYFVCGIGAALVQLGVYAWNINNYASALPPAAYDEVMTNGWATIQSGYNYANHSMAMLNQLVNGSTIGASGAVFGILLAFGVLFPRAKMYIFFIPYPINAVWVVLGYGLLELGLGFAGADDGIAHFAHLGGMLFGFLMLYYWITQYKRHGRY